MIKEIRNNRLYFDGCDTVELAKEYGTPIYVFSENDIDVMLCVPTDRPPLWLIESHPEIMISDKKGNTGKVCMNSPVFREYAARLTGKLAERYGSENKVAVWQTDHDISAFQCGCDLCCDKFRKWLLKKYVLLL